MKRTELRLKSADRRVVDLVRGSGLHLSREVTRAHILALNRGVSDAQICEVLGWSEQRFGGRAPRMARAAWSTRCTMLRPGKPRVYGNETEAELTALN